MYQKNMPLHLRLQFDQELSDLQDYRVAQIKIPHRTKCYFSTTMWHFIPKFLSLCGRDPATILKFKKNYFSFLQSYGYVNSLCHIFNSARNNQHQLVIFIHITVSVGVCFGGKGRLHLIPNKTKVNAKLYVETLLPEPGTCSRLQICYDIGFIFQQDGTPAHTPKLAQDWIATNCNK